MRIMLLMTLLGLGDQVGQVAKFDGRRPDAEYATAAKLEDVERCLIRVASPPQVYRQPDRPNEVTLVWTAGGVSASSAAGRVDLRRQSGAATKVVSWLSAKLVEPCAPRT